MPDGGASKKRGRSPCNWRTGSAVGGLLFLLHASVTNAFYVRMPTACPGITETHAGLGSKVHHQCSLPKDIGNGEYHTRASSTTPFTKLWLALDDLEKLPKAPAQQPVNDEEPAREVGSTTSEEPVFLEPTQQNTAPATEQVLLPDDDLVNSLAGGQYMVQNVLGRGSNGITYRCKCRDGGPDVAVKVLSFRNLRDWKQLELFEREGKILKGLQHPSIPRYLDYFEEDSERDRRFYLVQELAPGKTLADLVEGGWRPSEQEVSRIATQLLKALEYLSQLRPPIVHRDIKPENIVLEDGRPDGQVYLVDFGGVQGGVTDAPGSTIVGTYGYMAPEQFMGEARTSSDMYALGGTLLFLLSGGRAPGSFPQTRMKLDFESSVVCGERLRDLLTSLLQPFPEDRPDAQQALALLSGSGSRGGALAKSRHPDQATPWDDRILAPPPGALRQPVGSRAQVTRAGGVLRVEIPPGRWNADTVAAGGFALAWNAFVLLWTTTALAGGGIVFALFSLPFWFAGASIGKRAIGQNLVRETLEIGINRWRMSQQLALIGNKGEADWDDTRKGRKTQGGNTRDLVGARLVTMGSINGVQHTAIEMVEGVARHQLGEALSVLEQEWLAKEINDHIQDNLRISANVAELPPPQQ